MLAGVLRVLVNVTHESDSGCSTAASFDGVVEILLKCILQSPQYVLEEQRYVSGNHIGTDNSLMARRDRQLPDSHLGTDNSPIATQGQIPLQGNDSFTRVVFQV